jgi:hypothetical protein
MLAYTIQASILNRFYGGREQIKEVNISNINPKITIIFK